MTPPTSDLQPHDGSACPVPGDTVVEYKVSGGFQLFSARADMLIWERKEGEDDYITAYRIVRLAAPVPEASETPETDAAEFFLPSGQADDGVVFSSLSRSLETRLRSEQSTRELAVANLAHADKKIEELQAYIRGNQLASAADIISERDTLRAECERLRAALAGLLGIVESYAYGWREQDTPEEAQAKAKAARAALAQTKQV